MSPYQIIIIAAFISCASIMFGVVRRSMIVVIANGFIALVMALVSITMAIVGHQ